MFQNVLKFKEIVAAWDDIPDNGLFFFGNPNIESALFAVTKETLAEFIASNAGAGDEYASTEQGEKADNALPLATLADADGSSGEFVSGFDETGAPVFDTPAGGGNADEIYVTKQGNDTTGNGTKAAPYLTLQKAYDIGVAYVAANSQEPTIVIGPGIFTGFAIGYVLTRVVLKGAGFNQTTISDITFDSSFTEPVVIDGNNSLKINSISRTGLAGSHPGTIVLLNCAVNTITALGGDGEAGVTGDPGDPDGMPGGDGQDGGNGGSLLLFNTCVSTATLSGGAGGIGGAGGESTGSGSGGAAGNNGAAGSLGEIAIIGSFVANTNEASVTTGFDLYAYLT